MKTMLDDIFPHHSSLLLIDLVLLTIVAVSIQSSMTPATDKLPEMAHPTFFTALKPQISFSFFTAVIASIDSSISFIFLMM